MTLSDEDFITELKRIKRKHFRDNTWIYKGKPFVLGKVRIFDEFSQKDYDLIMKRAGHLVLNEERELSFFEKFKLKWGIF